MFKKFLYVPDNGIGICPAVLVGEENGLAVIWKVINGIVLERVVYFENLIKIEEEQWEQMSQML